MSKTPLAVGRHKDKNLRSKNGIFEKENCALLLSNSVYSYLPKTVHFYLPITTVFFCLS